MFFDFFNPMYDEYEDRKRRWEPEVPRWETRTYSRTDRDEPDTMHHAHTVDHAHTVNNADTGTHVDTVDSADNADTGVRARMERARDDGYRDGVRSVITSLLPGLSDMERAVDMMGDGDIPVGNIRVMLDKLLKCLIASGVERYGEPGDTFDPRIHNAIMHEQGINGNGSPNDRTIVYRVIDHGWMLNGEPIIPANVVTIDAPNTPLDDTPQGGTAMDGPDHNHGDDDGTHDDDARNASALDPYDVDTMNAIMNDEQLFAHLIKRINGQQ